MIIGINWTPDSRQAEASERKVMKAGLALMAAAVNEKAQDIGARRLHTVMEKLLEDLLFTAPEIAGREIVIPASYVDEKLAGIVRDVDVSRYIL